MSQITFCLTGYPQAFRHGERITFATRFDLALLLYLVYTQQPHVRDHLAQLLWPDDYLGDAKANLRGCLSRLRSDFGRWLIADRESVALVPDAGIHIDRTGIQPIGEGLTVSQPFAVWLQSIRNDEPVIIPDHWRPHSQSATTALADYCRSSMAGVVLRGRHIDQIDANFAEIMRIAISAPDPADNFVAASLLGQYCLQTQNRIGVILSLCRNLPRTTPLLDSVVTFGAAMFSATVEIPNAPYDSYAQIACTHTGSPDLIVAGYSFLTRSTVSLVAGNYREAAEYSQVAASYLLSSAALFKLMPVILAARCCALNGQYRAANAYLHQARIMMERDKSFHLRDELDTVQRLIETV